MSTTHSQVIDAINVRISNRIFSPDLIEEGILRQLMQHMDAMSVISGIRMTFVENHPELFERIVREKDWKRVEEGQQESLIVMEIITRSREKAGL